MQHYLWLWVTHHLLRFQAFPSFPWRSRVLHLPILTTSRWYMPYFPSPLLFSHIPSTTLTSSHNSQLISAMSRKRTTVFPTLCPEPMWIQWIRAVSDQFCSHGHNSTEWLGDPQPAVLTLIPLPERDLLTFYCYNPPLWSLFRHTQTNHPCWIPTSYYWITSLAPSSWHIGHTVSDHCKICLAFN